MHPTAIWAMRPYCVDAGTFAASRKRKRTHDEQNKTN